MNSLLDIPAELEKCGDDEKVIVQHPSVENVPTEEKEGYDSETGVVLSKNREDAETVKTLLDVVESVESFKTRLLTMKDEGVKLSYESLNEFNQEITMAFKKGNLEDPLPIYISQEAFSDIFGQDEIYKEVISRIEAINAKLTETINLTKGNS